MRPAKVMLVHDGSCVTVGKLVLLAKPLDAIVEAKQARAVLEMPKPLVKRSAGRFGNPSDQHLMRFFGVVKGHGSSHAREIRFEAEPRGR
jgi:type IV secretory pathway protease TraF